MAELRRSYLVREAGSPSRPGKVTQVYPYWLKSLLQAMEDARLASFAGKPHVVVRIEGRERTVIRRFEHGRQVTDQETESGG